MKIKLEAAHIYLASSAVDFRKQLNGLMMLISAGNEKLTSEAIYIFYNKSKNKLKLLSYHRNGFILIYKQIDKKKFFIKESQEEKIIITQEQLSWLLAGLDWALMSECSEYDYKDYY